MRKVKWAILGVLVTLVSMARADSEAGLNATLDGFHRAAANADIAAYFAAMTDNIVFLGTDGSERWQGDEFRDFVRTHFEAGRGWTYKTVSRQFVLAPAGQTAWFDETLHNEGLGVCRGSGVLVKTGEQWKIAQYNLSVPVPNEMVYELAADIAALGSAPVPAASARADSEVTAPIAPVVNPTAEVVPQDEAEPDHDCRRKRFKTNRKAGC